MPDHPSRRHRWRPTITYSRITISLLKTRRARSRRGADATQQGENVLKTYHIVGPIWMSHTAQVSICCSYKEEQEDEPGLENEVSRTYRNSIATTVGGQRRCVVS